MVPLPFAPITLEASALTASNGVVFVVRQLRSILNAAGRIAADRRPVLAAPPPPVMQGDYRPRRFRSATGIYGASLWTHGVKTV